MVAHALPYEQTDAYVGVIEALAGQGFDVQFISFDEILEGALNNLDVLINVGEAGTAFSGGDVWLNPELQVAVRGFVANGGGIIGVGEPCAVSANGAFNQLSDIFGIDQEQSWSLSTDRYPNLVDEHFILGEEDALDVELKGGSQFWVPVSDDVSILKMNGTSVELASSD